MKQFKRVLGWLEGDKVENIIQELRKKVETEDSCYTFEKRVLKKACKKPRGMLFQEKTYEAPIETKGFFQDSYENNRDSS